MSQENLDASRGLWAQFLAGDTAGVLTQLDVDLEVHDPPELPGAGIYHGHAGWLEQIAKFREAFEQMEYRVLEQIECGDDVVTVVAASATGATSGIIGDVIYAQLETWRNHKVLSIRYFLSRDAALEAAGSLE